MHGKFLEHIKHHRYDEAIDALAFPATSKFFVSQGIPRNESDHLCGEWLISILCAPIVHELRSQQGLNTGSFYDLVASLRRAAHTGFSEQQSRFQHTIDTFEALELIARVRVDGGTSSDVLPSAVRKAVDHLKGLDRRSPISLALTHGDFGKNLLHFSESLCKQRAQDIIATKQWTEADKCLRVWGGAQVGAYDRFGKTRG